MEKNFRFGINDINSKQELPLNLSDEYTPQAVDFSPDGNSIYFLNRKISSQGAEIYKTARFGGTAELIAGNVWSKFAVSPDGEKLAFYRQLSERKSISNNYPKHRRQKRKGLDNKRFSRRF